MSQAWDRASTCVCPCSRCRHDRPSTPASEAGLLHMLQHLTVTAMAAGPAVQPRQAPPRQCGRSLCVAGPARQTVVQLASSERWLSVTQLQFLQRRLRHAGNVHTSTQGLGNKMQARRVTHARPLDPHWSALTPAETIVRRQAQPTVTHQQAGPWPLVWGAPKARPGCVSQQAQDITGQPTA